MKLLGEPEVRLESSRQNKGGLSSFRISDGLSWISLKVYMDEWLSKRG